MWRPCVTPCSSATYARLSPSTRWLGAAPASPSPPGSWCFVSSTTRRDASARGGVPLPRRDRDRRREAARTGEPQGSRGRCAGHRRREPNGQDCRRRPLRADEPGRPRPSHADRGISRKARDRAESGGAGSGNVPGHLDRAAAPPDADRPPGRAGSVGARAPGGRRNARLRSFDVLAATAYGETPRTRDDRAARFARDHSAWLRPMPPDSRAAVIALTRQFAVGGTEELETASVLRVPAVARAGGLAALRKVGDPVEVLRATRERLFA